VGIGRQSLYDTFGDKRSLYIATLDHYFRTRGGPILAQLRAPGSPMANIKRVFAMWGKMAEDKHFSGCMIGNSAAEMAWADPEIAGRIAGYIRVLEDAFRDALVRAQEQGEISSKHDARDVARSFVNMIQGIALLSKVLHDPEMTRGVVRWSLKMLETA